MHHLFAAALPSFALVATASGEAVAQTQAARAGDFLDILGINGHIGSNVTPYLNATGTVTDAQYLGIRHWRDSLAAQASWQLAPLQALVNAGIDLLGVPLQNQSITVSQHIDLAHAWAALGPNALYALEGPNEPSNFPITYNGTSTGPAGSPTTFMPVAQFQSAYYPAIRADSVLNATPLWSVTLGGAEPDNAGVQYLTVPTPLPSGVLMPVGTAFADAANLHLYPMYDGGAQTVDQSADRIKDDYYSNFVLTYAANYAGYTQNAADSLPKVITEFGYAATGGTPGGVTVDVPTAGKNILTGLFNAWTEGYRYVDIYDLYDLGDGFGIFSGTNEPKASGTYLHNLTSALADTGGAQSFSPGSLTFSFSGLPSTGNALLLQKSTGQFELVVWNNVANWDYSGGTPIAVAPTAVGINLGAITASIAVYDPTNGTAPVQSLASASTVTVPLADYPLVVEITPLAAAVPTASLTAGPTIIRKGRTASLAWQSSGATHCGGGGFATGGTISGSATVAPSTTTTYSVACTGAGGTASATATVKVYK